MIWSTYHDDRRRGHGRTLLSISVLTSEELDNARGHISRGGGVSQSVDLGRSNNPNTTPTKDYEIVRVVVYLCSVQRGCAEEGERGSTPTG